MKVGYSVLLGEFIDARLLEHRDCEAFQVICPTCKEALFKVARSDGEAHVEYLSHYRASHAYVPTCDLRASSTLSTHTRHNSESRNQRLKYFLTVFSRLLTHDPFMSYQRGLSATHKMIERSKAWRFFRNHCHTSASSMMANSRFFEECADFYAREAFAEGGMPLTEFSLAQQSRIAADVMTMLSTSQARSNYDLLFNHASLYCISRMTHPNAELSEEDRAFANLIVTWLQKLMTCGARDGMELLKEMNSIRVDPPYVEQSTTILVKIASEIAHEMVGTLLRLPYLPALREFAKLAGGKTRH